LNLIQKKGDIDERIKEGSAIRIEEPYKYDRRGRKGKIPIPLSE
jgi:hypothetical protein